MTTYLYIKTHKITGLKYLGKTIQDPFKYKGSGTRWCNHLNVHGNEHDTEILMECQTKEEVKQWGLYYSELYNVVESPEWANLKPENGDGGGVKGVIPSPEHRAKLSEAAKNRSPEHRAKLSAASRNRSPEHRAKLSEGNRNRIISPETRAKISAAAKNRSPETRAKMSAASRNRIISPETRAKLSKAARARNARVKSPS
jgi:hypothetical protein